MNEGDSVTNSISSFASNCDNPVSDYDISIESLRAEIKDLNERIKKLEETIEIHEKILDAYSKRIRRLEEAHAPKDGSKRHLDELCSLMITNGIKQLTFARAAKLLNLSYRRTCQLKPLIEDDSRFVLIKDRTHKRRWLIRLRLV